VIADSAERTDELVEAGRCLFRGGPAADGAEKTIALTFDDGPNPPHTTRILDVLERYGVPATFFCVGLHVGAHREELARMAEAGHAVGNHTYSHPFLPDLSRREITVQLERTDAAIADAGARPTGLFRPPYGSRTPEILDWLAADGGPARRVVLWDVEPYDWALPGAGAIAGRVLADAAPGSVVLLHDGGGDRSQTAEALPAIVEGLLARDYRFVLVDELAG
jgi:peptidoglycan/xylan/chitin deacetylase (PgdA/CDA1 family)